LFIFVSDMLQKPLAFLLLISHINFFMFIAQVDEVDAYASDGSRISDINSVAEYINDIVLHHPNKTRNDEDDDNARYFHLVKLADYSFNNQVILSGSKTVEAEREKTFPCMDEQDLHSVFYDVVTPPPRFT
jgi:hypothetical protein